MAYTDKQKADLLKKAIKAAKDEKYHFIEQAASHLPISLRTFYEWKFQDSQELKEILEQNKIDKKAELREKWSKSDNATLNIALYKLLASDEEREILNDNKTIKLEDMPDIVVNVK